MTTATKPDKKAARKGALALGVAGALSWISSRMAWVRAEFVDDISGGGEATVNGADWSTETGAIAVLLLAGMVAAFALRRLGRRVIGAICTAASFGLAVPAVRLLLGGADPERVHALLTAGADEAQQGNSAPAIAQWADITSATTIVAGPGLALAAALLGLSLIHI